ncbi:MAG: helix-turn-helix transcriptional regulator [Prevotella sp.]|nr:helix-turn-helix transcriptional regulator [Candidatus Equicola faecalis]
MHIGHLIHSVVEEKNITIVEFSRQLSCSRTNVYKIFERSSIDTSTLQRISKILEHDFFKDISDDML